MAEPKCPECGVAGLNHIVSGECAQANAAGNPLFDVAFCDSCGHVYGVYGNVVVACVAPTIPDLSSILKEPD